MEKILNMSYKQIQKGKLTIILFDEEEQSALNIGKQVMESLQYEIQTRQYKGKLTPIDIMDDVRRLIRLEYEIMNSNTIFDYLPLTKDGNMPMNKNILLADSRYTFIRRLDSGVVTKARIQLRLTPCYETEMDFIRNTPIRNVQKLEIKAYDITKNTQTPIFDAITCLPHKPEQAKKVKYLLDSEIIPGRVYAEKSGTEYLFLGQIIVDNETWSESWTKPDESKGYPYYFYIRVTNKLKDAIHKQNITNLNSLYRMLAASCTDISATWITKCSKREKPRKFVSKVETLIEDSVIKNDSFTVSYNRGYTSRYTVSDILGDVPYNIRYDN